MSANIPGGSALAHSPGHDTEREAAASVTGLVRMRERVYDALRAYPQGLTDDEGGTLLHTDRLSFGRRRFELVEAGLVCDSGQRRPTPKGRQAIVWTAYPTCLCRRSGEPTENCPWRCP